MLAICYGLFFSELSRLNDQNKLRGNEVFTKFNLSLPKMPSVSIIKQLNGGLVMSAAVAVLQHLRTI